jgi:aspartyl protease family protein
MRLRTIPKGAFLVAMVLSCAALWSSVPYAQENEQLMPRFGETTREFEARKRGLPPPTPTTAPNSVTLLADTRGHFFVEPTVNGNRIRMMVDTGATTVSLTKEDAKLVGVNPAPADFTISASTANGLVYVAPVLLKEVAIGDISLHNVIAVVHPQNRLAQSLLGMSFLSKLSHVEIGGGRLVLKQ